MAANKPSNANDSLVMLGGSHIEFREAKTAYELNHAVGLLVSEYHRKEYIKTVDDQTHNQVLSSLKSCRTFVAWKGSRALTTMSYTLGETLPGDEVFGPELDEIRSQGHRVGEVCKLAGRSNFPVVFRLMTVVICEIKQFVDVVTVNVNPKHLDLYTKCFGGQFLSPEPRINPSVQAPAYGLYAPVERILSTPWIRSRISAQALTQGRYA